MTDASPTTTAYSMSKNPGKRSPKDEIRQKMEAAVVERAAKRASRAVEKEAAGEELKKAGNEYFKQGQYREAIKAWGGCRRAQRGSTDISVKHVCCTYQTGTVTKSIHLLIVMLKAGLSFAEAAELAQTALTTDPTFVKARYRRAIARKGLGYLDAAITDLETILDLDPDNKDALAELLSLYARKEDGEEGLSTNASDDEYPAPEVEGIEMETTSDSSDCGHKGNGVPCRYYNHEGCIKGSDCAYSHAPDEMSVRDKLGRNVCMFYLADACKFGAQRCVYSHERTYLPDGPRTIWNNKEAVLAMAEVTLQLKREGFFEEMDAESSKNPQSSHRKGKGRSSKQHKSSSSRPARRYSSESEEEMQERQMNYGYTHDELQDLLCQGIKPWDEEWAGGIPDWI